jgi:hypothetical protein
MESGGFKEEMFEKHLDRNELVRSWCKMHPRESSDTWHVVFIKQFGGKGIMGKWRFWRGKKMTDLVYEGGKRIQNINVRPFVTFVYDYTRS